ncbi:MAG: TonB family protein [Candidatus Eisenbacteria bacterium]
MRAPRGLSPYIALSLALHLVLYFFFVRGVSGARFAVPHPAAYRVSLVQLPGGSGPAAGTEPAPEAPGKPEEKAPEKKEEKTVRIPEKPRPMKKTEPKKTETEKKEAKKAETNRTKEKPPGEGGAAGGEGGGGTGVGTGSGSGFGSGSGTGIVGLDGVDFPFAYYLALIEARIGDRWVPPEGLVEGSKPPAATVRFEVLRDGRVHAPQITESSGISYFDLSTIRAVLDSDPFPPLPDGFPGERLGVNFVFRYRG